MQETVKDYVEQVLKEDLLARNNYNWLVIQTLRKMGLKIEVTGEILETMPSVETITRVCREIQNAEGRLMPNIETRKKRDKNEEKFQSYYSGKNMNYVSTKNSWMSV